MHTAVVDSRVRVLDPPRAVAEAIRACFEHDNPAKRQLAQLEETARRARGAFRKVAWGRFFAARDAPERYVTWKWDEGERVLSVPRGGLRRVRHAFQDAGFELALRDERGHGDPRLALPKHYVHRVEMRDYQLDLVQAAHDKQNCFWRSDTGSGKTTAALGLIIRVGLPAMVIVWTGGLRDQWVERVARELGVSKSDVGVVSGSTRRLRPITLAMQQTLWAMGPEEAARVANSFGLVFCDELDRFAARTFGEVIDVQTAKYRVGASADEKRKDGLEFLIYDAFGSVAGPEVPRAELIARGDVVGVDLRVVPTDFAPGWYFDLATHDRGSARTRLIGEMTQDRARNEQVTELVAAEVLAGEQVLVFSDRVDHCLVLEAMLRDRLPGVAGRTGRLIGGPENHGNFVSTAAGLRAGKISAAFGTYKAITYGTDLPSVARGVCATPMHSDPRQLNQVRGRICRSDKSSGKTGADLIYLWDRKLYGLSALRAIRRVGQTRVLDPDGQWTAVREFLTRESNQCEE